MFARALRFKRDPAEVRKFSEATLTLAEIVGRDPAEVDAWDVRDKRWMLCTYQAQVEAEAERARRAGEK